MASLVYERRRPETSTLYHVVQENLDTLYGAVEDGALAIALPKFVKKELEGYLECGLLCHNGGLSAEQIRTVVMANVAAIRRCYQVEAERNPSLRGGVTLQWTIDQSGRVERAAVVKTTLDLAPV